MVPAALARLRTSTSQRALDRRIRAAGAPGETERPGYSFNRLGRATVLPGQGSRVVPLLDPLCVGGY